VPEKRIVLRNCGIVNPRDINSYLEKEGFKALVKAREEMDPEEVIQEIKSSGLRGRGGAGFPCGAKWELARKSEGQEKYLICNADEGEMGTFKDRFIIQNDPFSLVEGIAIAAYGIGADNAYVYLRAEYRFLADLIKNAIHQAKEKGFLGELNIVVREGAGSYVCGEESALMNSIEGRRGEARFRPPFPPQKGLWGKPTVINNVETLMNVPPIILKGSSWFRSIGTDESKGTKVFSVSGDVERPGVYELVLGSSLRELTVDLAGAKNGAALLVGGAAGRLMPFSIIEEPLSFETILGAGAVMVFDKDRDIIEFIYRTSEFFAEESCGKCTPCREGTEVMVEILGRLARGEGAEADIDTLNDLSKVMAATSLCGLGQGASTFLMDALDHFRKDFESRVDQSLFLKRLRVP